MTGFQSRVRDVINQAAPTHGVVSVASRGLSHFLDPSMTGRTRFMQKSGYPFPLLSPQMSAVLLSEAAAGTQSVLIEGARLLSWLKPGMTVSFELLENAVIDSVQEQATPGEVLVVLRSNLLSSHAAGTRLQLRFFPIYPADESVAGDGGLGAPAITVISPFILVPGDVLLIEGKRYSLTSANQTSMTGGLFYYEVKTTDAGFPALLTSTNVSVVAKPVYRSEVLSMPHVDTRSLIRGPVAIDWVSGPLVTDYRPSPESEVFLEEFDSANNPISDAFPVQKNDTLTRLPIARDQMLFWRVADGSVNWNGSFMELRAFDSGRAHIWTPCRPPLDAAPITTSTSTVPSFSPFAVILLSRFISGSLTVYHGLTKAEIPSSQYSIDEAAGLVTFLPAWANTPVILTYRPRMEWQLLAIPSVAGIEVTAVVGREAKQVFTLGGAGSSNLLTIKAETSTSIDQLHLTARRSDDSGGEFIVQLGDWQGRGRQTAALRYTITTAADVDYDWASSGLLLKPLWPTIELLRARLDGDSLFSRYLDNGRMLF